MIYIPEIADIWMTLIFVLVVVPGNIFVGVRIPIFNGFFGMRGTLISLWAAFGAFIVSAVALNQSVNLALAGPGFVGPLPPPLFSSPFTGDVGTFRSAIPFVLTVAFASAYLTYLAMGVKSEPSGEGGDR